MEAISALWPSISLAGSPGNTYIKEKVTVITPNNIRMVYSNFLTIKVNISTL
jgi:hypothetical protein